MLTLPSLEATSFYSSGVKHPCANQMWYQSKWRRFLGCGPIACANIAYYISHTNHKLIRLAPKDCCDNETTLSYINEVWSCYKPGYWGVYKTKLFIKGLVKYARKKKASVTCTVLELSSNDVRPSHQEIVSCISSSIMQGIPVAFLNRTNSTLDNLDEWHWVTIVAIDPLTSEASIFDYGTIKNIQLGSWITNNEHGGFVIPHFLDE